LFLLEKPTGLFHGFGRTVTVIQAEQSDGATVNTPTIIDHFVKGRRGMALRAE
jgi:hypothetical protein